MTSSSRQVFAGIFETIEPVLMTAFSRLLGEQKESTYWDNPETCYVPKYASCIWKLIVLADLGVSGEDQPAKNSVEHFFGLHNVETGGFAVALRPKGSEKFDPHVCATGNMVRTPAKFGLADDDRVGKAIDWLLSQQLADGGWNCYAVWVGGKHGSFKATIEPLWALSELLQKTILELSGKNRQREHQSSS